MMFPKFRLLNVLWLAIVVLTLSSKKLFASQYNNKNEMLCDQPKNQTIESVSQIKDLESSNSSIQTLIKLNQTTEIILQKINTSEHLSDRYYMWLKKSSLKKPDQYFLIHSEYSTGAGEFPIIMKSNIYPNNTFAYQTGIEGYDVPQQFGRYKVIFQYKTPIKNQLILEKTLCVRPIFQ